MKITRQEALEYHEKGRKGKIQVVPTKPYSTQKDLSLAYSPGVAEPVKAIAENPESAYKYTAKGNLIAVVTNGTAILGLGNKGALAAKPVMEGKGVLFKVFADIDVFDIEVDTEDPDKFIETVKAIAPTFGGINLEDIKAPEAFYIEERLKKEVNIPVMHDDQHGTAIISGAALLNALEIAGKEIDSVKFVVSGAGAAALSCIKLYLALGAKLENFSVFDSQGIINTERKDLDKSKEFLAVHSHQTSMEEAMKDSDVFIGLSRADVVTEQMVLSMAPDPVVFALANPDPEIDYETAKNARPDVIMATGRSDHPNQVNNVLGFPYIFRGALDVRATAINEEMKLAAAYAIAKLTKEPVPESVNQAYGIKNMMFGRDLIIPKPLDPRLLVYVSKAVARAAMDSGVAREVITDWDAYERELNERMGHDNQFIRRLTHRARKHKKRVVFAEADNYKILKAAQICIEEGYAEPILLGNIEKIRGLIEEHHLELEGVKIHDPAAMSAAELEEFASDYYAKRQRKGVTYFEAAKRMKDRNYYGLMMVKHNQAEIFISGISRKYPGVIRPALEVIGLRQGVNKVVGMYIMVHKKRGPMFFADTTVHFEPTAEELSEIAVLVSNAVREFHIEPRVALLSYSNFGSSNGEEAKKVRRAVEILHHQHPALIVDGEIQANFALNPEMLSDKFNFSKLSGKSPNVLIFPNLSAGNIAYKLMQEMAEVEAIGPVLLGMDKSVHILQLGSSVKEIVDMVKIAVVQN